MNDGIMSVEEQRKVFADLIRKRWRIEFFDGQNIKITFPFDNGLVAELYIFSKMMSAPFETDKCDTSHIDILNLSFPTAVVSGTPLMVVRRGSEILTKQVVGDDFFTERDEITQEWKRNGGYLAVDSCAVGDAEDFANMLISVAKYQNQ